VRRVEALVGIDAFRFLARESLLVSQLSEQLKARREELPERISGIVTRLRDAERDLQRFQAERLLGNAGELAAGAADIGGVACVTYQVPDGTPADGIRTVALDVRGRLAPGVPGVVVVAGVPSDRPTVVVAVNDAARARGIKAGALVLTAAGALGGRGGGKDDVAQGGGAPLGDGAAAAIGTAFRAVTSAIKDIPLGGGVV
jgi:alanyl-tRNA synthetase